MMDNISNKNTQLTQLDTNQIVRHQYDENYDAQRVILVAGSIPDVKVEVDPSRITDAISKGLERLSPSPSIAVQIIEIPKVITETRIEKIEIPIIIKEIEYKEIKVPFEVPKYIEVEKQIIIKEQGPIQIINKSTIETKYLRIALVCMVLFEILTILLKK